MPGRSAQPIANKHRITPSVATVEVRMYREDLIRSAVKRPNPRLDRSLWSLCEGGIAEYLLPFCGKKHPATP
jgi:hypothetical protein